MTQSKPKPATKRKPPRSAKQKKNGKRFAKMCKCSRELGFKRFPSKTKQPKQYAMVMKTLFESDDSERRSMEKRNPKSKHLVGVVPRPGTKARPCS